MRNVLIPVDGSRRSEIAVQAAIRQARLDPVDAIHLVNVQPSLGGYIASFVSRAQRDAFRREQGLAALADARRLLDQAGVPYTIHIRVGEAVEAIVAAAEDLGADEIVVGVDGSGLFGRIELHPFVNRLIRRSPVPVSVVKQPTADMAFNSTTGSWWLRSTS